MQLEVNNSCLMRVAVITLFPEMFSALTASGVTRKAFEEKLVDLRLINPRDFASDKHRTVDDRPYGGGPGMVMKASPLEGAVELALSWFRELRQGDDVTPQEASEDKDTKESRVHIIYMSPQGEMLDTALIDLLYQRCCKVNDAKFEKDFVIESKSKCDLEASSNHQDLIVIAGRYEGIDERFISRYVDQEVSIGDYVLSGGELPAMVMLDSLLRKIPGVLGDMQSFEQDSFEDGLLDYPHYTRPEMYKDLHVPEVLLSGDHKRIDLWRKQQALGRTWLRRPDLLEKLDLSERDRALLKEFKKS